MKKTVGLIFLFFTGYLGVAQVTLQPFLPQAGLFQKSQLWNMLAVNSSSYSRQCYIVLSLQDRKSGAEIMSATSAAFTLEKGGKQLNEASIAPIQYTYFSFSGDKTNDFLPVGSYMACFKLEGSGHESGEVSEACVPFDVEPLSPPILILPSDSSVLQVQPGQFSWQPPAPLTMFQQLHYELVIAEILPGQKPEEAIELNAPFYIDLNVSSNLLNYTAAYPSFEKDKWYAWQVVAQDGENYAAKTQVWDFTIPSQQTPAVQPLYSDYILLRNDKENSEGIHALTGNAVNIKYYSYDKDHTGIIHFIGPDGKEVEEKSIQITYGDNFLTYKLDNKFRKGSVYAIELTDNKKNKNTAFFTIK